MHGLMMRPISDLYFSTAGARGGIQKAPPAAAKVPRTAEVAEPPLWSGGTEGDRDRQEGGS